MKIEKRGEEKRGGGVLIVYTGNNEGEAREEKSRGEGRSWQKKKNEGELKR